MATQSTRVVSGSARYAWTAFVGLGALMILLGVGDMFSAATSPSRENSLNELLIGLFGVAIAVYGLRRGERWAWYAMLLWPLWLIAQSWRAFFSAGVTGAANSILTSLLDLAAGYVFLILIVAALALSYRTSFSNHR
jgi:hypothetical protein